MVSQIKNKRFTFAEFFGLFLFLRRLALNISKKWMCPFNRSLIGAFGGENKTGLEFCPSVLWLGLWPLANSLKYFIAKIRLGGPKSGWTLSFSSKRWKCGSLLWRFVQRKKKKNKFSSPPSENRRRVFKQPSSEQTVTSKSPQDREGLFNWLNLILLLLWFWKLKGLVKPCKVWGNVTEGWKRSEGRLSCGRSAADEWPERPNHINHKTHCGCETSPLQKGRLLFYL